MIDDKLKPCPRCKAAPVTTGYVVNPEDHRYWVECMACGYNLKLEDGTKEQARERWNDDQSIWDEGT